jgi:hypothetical protein
MNILIIKVEEWKSENSQTIRTTKALLYKKRGQQKISIKLYFVFTLLNYSSIFFSFKKLLHVFPSSFFLLQELEKSKQRKIWLQGLFTKGKIFAVSLLRSLKMSFEGEVRIEIPTSEEAPNFARKSAHWFSSLIVWQIVILLKEIAP